MWFNPKSAGVKTGLSYVGLDVSDTQQAAERLQRFVLYFCRAFPEPKKRKVF